MNLEHEANKIINIHGKDSINHIDWIIDLCEIAMYNDFRFYYKKLNLMLIKPIIIEKLNEK